MKLEKTDIEQVLQKAKLKEFDSIHILEEIKQILEAGEKHKGRIENDLMNGNPRATSQFNFDLLASENIYHLDQIRKICTDYRLRFLDSKYFKGDIPQEAISKIQHLEKEHNTVLSNFKIIAPSKLFKLKDKDDPLLFVTLGNDYFYFIHKWGNDLHPLRKTFMWPFKNIVNLAITVFVLSYLTTLLIPMELFSKTNTGYEFWLLFLFIFKSAVGVVIFYGFAKGKNFNHAIWNSRYFNY